MTALTTKMATSSQIPLSRLVLLLYILPIDDSRRLLLFIGGPAVMRLSVASRSLQRLISRDNRLWQALYHKEFAYTTERKEMDFLLGGIPDHHMTSELISTSDRFNRLQQLNWTSTFAYRMRMEQNWRAGRYTTCKIQLPEMETDGEWSVVATCTAGLLLREAPFDTDEEWYSKYIFLRADSPTMDSTKRIITLEGLVDATLPAAVAKADLDERFIVLRTVNPNTNVNQMRIWPTGAAQCLHTIPLPDYAELHERRGRWALVRQWPRPSSSNSNNNNPGNRSYNIYTVWDLEKGICCPGEIRTNGNTVCLHDVDEITATVYLYNGDVLHEQGNHTTTISNDGGHQWAMYRLQPDQPPCQVQTNQLALLSGMDLCVSVRSVMAGQLILTEQSGSGRVETAVHSTVPRPAKSKAIATTSMPLRGRVLRHHLPNGRALSLHGDTGLCTVYRLTDGQILHTFKEPSAKIRAATHVLGSLALLTLSEPVGGSPPRILVDFESGKTLRKLDNTSKSSDEVITTATYIAQIQSDEASVTLLHFGA